MQKVRNNMSVAGIFFSKRRSVMARKMLSKPFLEKKFTDSDPTKPLEPVIKTMDIL